MRQSNPEPLRTGQSYFVNPATGRTWTICLADGQIQVCEGRLDELQQKPETLPGDAPGDAPGRQAARYYQLVAQKEAEGYVEVASDNEFFPKTLPRLRKRLLEAGLGRPAWLPETEAVDIVDWGNGSYYGGASWIEDQPLPHCEDCRGPLSHLLQLDLAQLPSGFDFPLKSGLVKLYYCLNQHRGAEYACDYEQPGPSSCGKFYLNLYVPASNKGLVVGAQMPALPLKGISSWEPLRPELPELDGLVQPPVELSQTEKAIWAEHLKAMTGDKLGGCPHWLQGFERFDCPDCNQPMSLLYQLDSAKELPVLFGNRGLGHVWICADHPQHVFFVWRNN